MIATVVELPTDVTTRRSRAADLRLAALGALEPVAVAYRRRAAELELEATVLAARLGFEEEFERAA